MNNILKVSDMNTRVVCTTALEVSRFLPIRLSSSFNMVKKPSPHLKTGDAQPPLQKGLLRLYNMHFCPYAQRAVLVLDAKKVPYDVVNCNLSMKPEWLFEKSVGAKVPAIEFEDGTVLSESLIIADFLNEAYPDPPLYPKDPRSKAIDRLLIEKYNAVPSAFYRIIMKDDGYTKENMEGLVAALEVFEKELVKRGTKFFGGASPTMLDLMTWPWIERVPLLELRGGSDFVMPKDRLPALSAWRENMLSNEVVKQSALPPSIHNKFLESRKNAVYDFSYDDIL